MCDNGHRTCVRIVLGNRKRVNTGQMAKSSDTGQKLRQVRRELRKLQKELDEHRQFRRRLAKAMGYDEIPAVREMSARMYGWLNCATANLERFLENVAPYEIRSDILRHLQATFAQLVIEGKYGLRVPLSTPKTLTPEEAYARWLKSLEDQGPARLKEYLPCVICGEDRITHDCHIIPRREGGIDHIENYVALCPLHHHLFDHRRLKRDEWAKLMDNLDGKLETAIAYMTEIHLPWQQLFWGDLPEGEYPLERTYF